MKRRLFMIVVFLFLGGIVNVGVAWSISALTVIGDGSSEAGSIRTPAGESVPYLHWRGRGIERIKWHLYLGRGQSSGQYPIKPAPTWSEVASRVSYNDNRHPFFVNVRGEVASGWPLLSMRSCHAVEPTSGAMIYEPRKCAIPLSDHQSPPSWHLARHRALPLIPIWSGFFSNTLFYAAILSLLWSSPFVVRRLIRRKRGLCIKCGYDLRGAEHEVCPECGRRVLSAITERSPR